MADETADAQRAQLLAMLGEIHQEAEVLRETTALDPEAGVALLLIEHSTSELVVDMQALLDLLCDHPPRAVSSLRPRDEGDPAPDPAPLPAARGRSG